MNTVSSKHLRNASELLVFAPIRREFIEKTDVLVSHASRLIFSLEGLFVPLRSFVEKLLVVPSGNVIEKLQTIYSVQYAVVERPDRSHLVVAVSFDTSWEAYMQVLVDQVGDLLDLIFSHCEGYDRNCRRGYEAFSQWINQYQVKSNLFYHCAPDLTADDIRYLRLSSRGKANRVQPFVSTSDEANAALKEAVEHGWASAAEAEKVLVDTALAAFTLREWFTSDTDKSLFNAATKQLLAAYGQQGLLQPQPHLPPEVGKWLLQEVLGAPADAPPQMQTVNLTSEDLDKVQVNILKSYDPETSVGAVALLVCEDPGRLPALLEDLRKRVTTAHSRKDEVRVNLAITYQGLARLGLDQATLDSFPKEFREGMAARAGTFGDVGPNDPERWDPPVPLSGVDVVLLFESQKHLARDREDAYLFDEGHPLFKYIGQIDEGCRKQSARVAYVQPLRRYPEYDHFKVADGTGVQSQPVPNVTISDAPLDASAAKRDLVALGELLLGYKDCRGKISGSVLQGGAGDNVANTLFKNGTFLVMRKLDQAVDAFEEYVKASADHLRANEREVRGWLVGRTPDGEPLAAPGNIKDNDYDYSQTSQACPLHAHVRRANPRTNSKPSTDRTPGPLRVPRIMRRSFPYGPKGEKRHGEQRDEQGLLFMCYGARIAQQFEVVQRWLNGGNSTQILSSQNDILTGVPQPAGGTYPVPAASAPRDLRAPVQPFVRLRWGMYLFVPSLDALAALSHLRGGPTRTMSRQGYSRSPATRDGDAIVEELDAIKNPDEAKQAWKEYIEDPLSTASEAVWASVQRSGGPKRTPYGVLVADVKNARTVLSDDGTRFSVREYWNRLHDKLGPPPHYLTLDPVPDGDAALGPAGFAEDAAKYSYADLAKEPNSYIERIDPGTAYDCAKKYTIEALKTLDPSFLNVRTVAKIAVSRLVQDWIGMPSAGGDDVQILEHYILLSRYAFQPYPEDWLKTEAAAAADDLKTKYRDRGCSGPMAKALRDEGYDGSDPTGMRTIVATAGAIVGFAPPAVAASVRVLCTLLENEEFEPLALAAKDAGAYDRALALRAVLQVLRVAPVPPLLYRLSLVAQGPFRPGDLVVVGLGAVANDAEATESGYGEPWDWLFGGPRNRPRKPGDSSHGCPARGPAISAIAGILTGFFEYPKTKSKGLFAVSLNG